MMHPALIATLVVGGIGLTCGAALALAAHCFRVSEDPRVTEILDQLPGINCGGCGFASCAAYARAIAESGAELNRCTAGGAEVRENLGTLMGVCVADEARMVAVVRCGGDDTEALRRFAYNGIADCNAAQALDGGDKACTFGCLGYGSCARVCPVNAITITPERLAVVDPRICIGCRRCVEVCPRNIITMAPAERTLHVLCMSQDKGAMVRKVCGTGCIGCRTCVKLSDGAIAMDGFLAVVDYDQPLSNPDVVERCPTHCIRTT